MTADPQNALNVALVIRDHHPRADAVRDELARLLSDSPGISLRDVRATDAVTGWDEPIDLMVVVGGDGSILRTCRQLGLHQLPMLGVNLGRLGFLADLSPEDFRERLPDVIERRYRVVPHLMFATRLIHADGSSEEFLGLNETAVLAGGALCMIDIDLSIDGEPVTNYSCDGLILSTPVGSTAHSLAAGGPILRQDLQAFVITPISPHTLTNRPLIDGANCVYQFEVPRVPEGATLVIDGQVKRPLQPGDRVDVRKAPVDFQLVRLWNHSYYKTLHRKLGWGGQPRYSQPPL